MPFYPLALWERVAEDRVRDTGLAILYGKDAMQKFRTPVREPDISFAGLTG